MEVIKVSIEKYKSLDGNEFFNKDDCILSDKFFNGVAKTCPSCKGLKEVDPYGDGRTFIKCSNCKGKGFVEKTESWV